MKTNRIKAWTLTLFLAFYGLTNAQQGFRAEANIGLTSGDAGEVHSMVLQGNLYYFWPTTETIDLGVTTGALVFLGDASEDFCDGCPYDDYEAELYIPISLAGRARLSKAFAIGLDTGYAVLIHIFNGGGGFYLRPLITYDITKKLALVASYTSIFGDAGNYGAINLGVNFGF